MQQPTQITFGDLQEYTKEFKNMIGAGGYGQVFRGKIPRGNRYDLPKTSIAVKAMLDSTPIPRRPWVLRTLQAELRVLSVCDHPNVVKILAFCTHMVAGEERLYLVLEYIKGRELSKVLKDLKWNDVVDLLKKVAKAIKHVHDFANIVHCDINPRNILVDKHMEPKLIDFGLATEEGHVMDKHTPGYYDIFFIGRRNGQREIGDDMFSFGVIILQMVMKKVDIYANLDEMVPELGFGECHLEVYAGECYARNIGLVHPSLTSTGCDESDGEKVTRLGLFLTAPFNPGELPFRLSPPSPGSGLEQLFNNTTPAFVRQNIDLPPELLSLANQWLRPRMEYVISELETLKLSDISHNKIKKLIGKMKNILKLG